MSTSPNARCGSWLVSEGEYTVLTALTAADYTASDVRRVIADRWPSKRTSGWRTLGTLMSLAHRGLITAYFHNGELLWTLNDDTRKELS